MKNEDRKVLMENVASMPRNNKKGIEIHGGAGEIGIKVVKVAQWKTKCKSYFDRYYKTSSIIVVPSGGDIIMNTLSFLCSDSKGRGFVFKNYDIAKHMEFLGYSKAQLKANLGVAPVNESISYIAYIEQKNTVFICEKVSKVLNVNHCLKNLAVIVKYFLTLYHKEIQASGVTIIGLLIRENEKEEELVECKFCHLFSPLYKLFESPPALKDWWNSIETYEGWWNLANPKNQNQLFCNIAAEILCFMAVQEKGLPALTDDKSQQFRQTYFLYTPQQMDIHFSEAKHVVIQGSYGSGKSILGLKKLELIWKSLKRDENIVYINFDWKSNLHFLMEKNVREYVGISSRKIKHVNNIQDILGSPDQLIYVCHNRSGENLSAILQETVRLNMNASQITKTNSHLIIEEYDGETLSRDEAAKIMKLIKSSNLMETSVILLAQPLMKNRSWKVGNKSYEKETCMFHELKDIFKIVKLEQVLRCSNEICGITKCTQNFVQNKDSVFQTKMSKVSFKHQHQPEENKKHMISPNLSDWNYPEMGTSINGKVSNPGSDLNTGDKIIGHGMDLDQAFKRSTPIKKSNGVKNKIVSKFGFLCEPRKGLDIEGLKPNLVEFSDNINSTSDIAVIALTLVLKNFIGENKTTTVLHMADKQPGILKRTIQLLPRLLDETYLFTNDIGVFLQKKKQSKIIFSSNVSSVNGMEFDHVIIVVSQSEYYLKYYLPQAISRCTYDLTFVLLPEDKMNTRKGSLLSYLFSKSKNNETKETVVNIVEELKREGLVNQVGIAECKTCENNCHSYSVLNEIHNRQTFQVHTHVDQYKDYLFYLANYAELEEQPCDTSAHGLADAK